MTNGVIISAHGEFAKGLKTGLDLVVGSMPNIRVVNFVEGDNYDIIDANFQKAFDELKDCKNILIITDLKGGTPFNRAVTLFSTNENVRVLSGLNFAMTYQAMISDAENIEDYLKEVIDTGKDSIDYFEFKIKEDDIEEDGI